MKKQFLAAAALVAILAPATAAHAVHNWVLPSTMVLSGDNAWIAVDAATSDHLYQPNLRPLRMEAIQIVDSEGQPVTPQNAVIGKFRSSFDVQVAKPGTYKIAATTLDVIASYTADGVVKRFRGTGADFAKQVPADAADLKTVRSVGRFETFVTRDKPTTAVFTTTGQGIEMVPVTHPADVVAEEPVTFKFLLDGKAASGLEVTFKRGGDNWKADPYELKAKADAQGVVKVTLPEGGFWWMGASYQTGETGRGPGPGGPPPGQRAPGAPPPPAQPLSGDGYSALYSATIEAQMP